MPGLHASEDETVLAGERTREKYEKELSVILADLKADRGNPDFWMKAVSLYRALGDGRRAYQCAQVSLKVAAGRWCDDQVAARVGELLRAEGEPSAGEEDDLDRVPGARRETASRDDLEEEGVRPWKPEGWGSGEERPSLMNEQEAIEQLQGELSPQDTVPCPHCNTLLRSGSEACYGCGQERKEHVATLEERVSRARARLKEDEEDAEALFTLAAYLAVDGQYEEALERLIRLTALDSRYPGLWWIKARIFGVIGRTEAANSSIRMALKIEAEEGDDSES